MIEVGKYYSAYPEFTKEVDKVGRAKNGAPTQKMTGLCIFASPRIVTLAFANGIRESFRPDEVK